jgi:hypothetical protein
MNLMYKIYYNCYDINYLNVASYRYWDDGLPVGVYKAKFFALYFWTSYKQITNYSYGIKLDFFNYETEVQ